MHSELASPSRVREILSGLDVTPSKTLGQNFLIDANILGIVMDAAEVTADDRVLEIGPGLGILTEALLCRAGHVVAMEKDRRLYNELVTRLGSDAGITLECCDALERKGEGLSAARCNKMVANLPYNVASRILVELAGLDTAPRRIVVTVQEEVARRLAAMPSDADYGLLSVRVQLRYSARIVKKVSPNCFWPRPRVGSMIVCLDRVSRPSFSPAVERMFERVTKQAFEHRRKQMRGILVRQWTVSAFSMGEAEVLLERVGICPAARPEEIDVAHWIALAEALVMTAELTA